MPLVPLLLICADRVLPPVALRPAAAVRVGRCLCLQRRDCQKVPDHRRGRRRERTKGKVTEGKARNRQSEGHFCVTHDDEEVLFSVQQYMEFQFSLVDDIESSDIRMYVSCAGAGGVCLDGRRWKAGYFWRR